MPLGRGAVMWKGKGNREGRERAAFWDFGEVPAGRAVSFLADAAVAGLLFADNWTLESGWQRAGRGGRFGLSVAETRPRSTQRP